MHAELSRRYGGALTSRALTETIIKPQRRLYRRSPSVLSFLPLVLFLRDRCLIPNCLSLRTYSSQPKAIRASELHLRDACGLEEDGPNDRRASTRRWDELLPSGTLACYLTIMPRRNVRRKKMRARDESCLGALLYAFSCGILLVTNIPLNISPRLERLSLTKCQYSHP